MQRDEYVRRSYDLYDKIRKRIYGEDIPEGEEFLNAEDLALTMHSAIAKHNVVLKDKVEEDTKKLNKIVRRSRILGKRVPFVFAMTPIVREDTTQEIEILLMEEGHVQGKAIIKPDLTITFDFLRPYYKMDDVLDLLRKNHVNFITYFNALNNFMLEYPGIEYEFGKSGNSKNSVQELGDGFIDVKINLNGDCCAWAALHKLEDLELSRSNITADGAVYDYMMHYNDQVLASFKVDESKLNPFFKRVLENKRELGIDPAEEPAGRVLRV